MTRVMVFRFDRCRYALLFGIILVAGLLASPSNAAAVQWHHEECSNLVKHFTDYEQGMISLLVQVALLLNAGGQINRLFGKECVVTCHDWGEKWHRLALEAQKIARGKRKNTEKTDKGFQSWIDFMDKCLSATGDLEQRQDFVKGFTLVKNEFVAARLTAVSIIEKYMVKDRLRYAEMCRVRCSDPYHGLMSSVYGQGWHIQKMAAVELLPRHDKLLGLFSLKIDDLDKYMKSLES